MNSRRNFLTKSGLIAAGVGAVAGESLIAQMPRSVADPNFVVKNGRIRQSVMGWCLNKHFSAIELAHHCKAIGLVAMEGIPRSAYPDVKKLGLVYCGRAFYISFHFVLLYPISHEVF